jgi:mannose-6-phosphate isomerase-like protein (cupin superfamily)
MKLVNAIKLSSFALLLVVSPLAFAQAAAPQTPAAKPAEVFKAADIKAALDKLAPTSKEKGSGGSVFGDYDTHAIQLSLRNASGGAEIHRHKDDVFFVIRGSATLITGGTVVDPKEGAGGEIKGTSIKDGVSQTISAGDVVHIPAGTPHMLILTKGEEFGAVVIKIKE